MISVKKLSLKMGNTVILDSITADFTSGKIHGLVGRNGSGKTMLMKCIAGFIQPTSGGIEIDGTDIGKSGDFPRNMGIIIETPGFLPYYSGLRNLTLLAELSGKSVRCEVEACMRTVGLDPKLKIPVEKYSLGMRQRLGLAQAILEKPDILLLDEPFNGLDKAGTESMRHFLLEYCTEQRTILISSHNSADISILCDSVWEMEQGILVQNAALYL